MSLLKRIEQGQIGDQPPESEEEGESRTRGHPNTAYAAPGCFPGA